MARKTGNKVDRKEQSMQDRLTDSKEVPIRAEEMAGRGDELDSVVVESGLGKESGGERRRAAESGGGGGARRSRGCGGG
jgi:hypothetical protein